MSEWIFLQDLGPNHWYTFDGVPNWTVSYSRGRLAKKDTSKTWRSCDRQTSAALIAATPRYKQATACELIDFY